MTATLQKPCSLLIDVSRVNQHWGGYRTAELSVVRAKNQKNLPDGIDTTWVILAVRHNHAGAPSKPIVIGWNNSFKELNRRLGDYKTASPEHIVSIIQRSFTAGLTCY